MSLATRFTLFIVGLAVVIGGIAGWVMSSVMRDILERELERRAVVVAETLAEHLTDMVADGEVTAVNEFLQDAVRRTDGAAFAYVTGFGGAVLADPFDDGVPGELQPHEHEVLSSDNPLVEKYSTDSGAGILIGYPLVDGEKADLYIGLDESSVGDQISYMRGRVSIVVLVTTLLAVIAGAIASRAITRPLGRLSASLRAYGEGKPLPSLDDRRGCREVKELTLAFNQMIADRTRAEEALREQTELAQRYLDLAGVLFVALDQDGCISMINQRGLDILGYTEEYLVGRNWIETCLPERAREPVMAVFRQLMAGELEPVEYFENPVLTCEGEERIIAWHNTVLRGKAGEVTGILSSGEDITERKRAEEELRQSEEKYRLLVDNAGEAIVVLQDDRLKFANRRTAEIIGFTEDETVERSFLGFVHPEDRDIISTRYQARLDGEELPAPPAFRVVGREGEVVWLESSAVLIEWQGRPATLTFLKDITDRRELEVRFLQAQKMEAVGRLAAGMAHDFNNVLTAIMGYTSFLLKATAPGDPRREDVDDIQNAAQRATALTQQLLALSRRQVLRPTVVNLNDVVSDVTNMLRRMVGEDIELVTRPASDTVPVEVDPGQIEQVIMNLVVNAREAMPDGGRIVVSCDKVELYGSLPCPCGELHEGHYVVLEIRDTGGGMDEGTRMQVFEPFFTTKDSGTGLGLSTVYGIVIQSGGHITVDSEPGRGTTFRVYLPQVEAGAAETDSRESSDASDPDRLSGSETILVVEDASQVRDMACRVLRDNGYSVLEARDGDSAVEVCQEHEGPIHVLLTDLVMPGGMNGLDLAERLSALRPSLRVVFMSGYFNEVGNDRRITEAGAAFMEKPFTPSLLLGQVRAALDE